MKKTSRKSNPECTEMRHGDVILTLQLNKKLSILKYAYMMHFILKQPFVHTFLKKDE